MKIDDSRAMTGTSAVVTGGASGLGAATCRGLRMRGADVVILDLPSSNGSAFARSIGATFSPGDVTVTEDVEAALDKAEAEGPVRALVSCAGRGGTVRVLERSGDPGSLEEFESIVRVNLLGTFNVLRLTAARMRDNQPVGDDRGVCVLTSSVAAWEGQVGQTPYASAKAGINGMTLVAARDLASVGIRVATIAPGVFDTPILARFSEEQRASLAAAVPHPRRLGRPAEFAALALHILDNPMINGETIRLDGAIRMGAR
jgi:NAD(P)-dependent dehydrogenase (short-subunit alcohol dehydrogenase family)